VESCEVPFTIDELESLLRRFIDGPDRSIARANEIEVALDPFVEDDDELADLRIALASYRPEGARLPEECLWGETDMIRLCRESLPRLRAKKA
jgi:hypothetical protein